MTLSLLIAAVSVFIAPIAGMAADLTSVQALLKQGYEIKGTVFLPLPDVKAQWADAVAGSMLLTLQKEQSVAVCELNWANWSSLAQATLENAELCRVLKP